MVALWASTLCFAGGMRGDTLYVADFGVKTNSRGNASAALSRAVEACRGKGCKVLVLPGGRVDLWAEGAAHRTLYISNATENDSLPKERSIGLLLEDMRNVTVEGNNTKIVLHDKMISFALLRSTNIRIRNVRFDYERPTMSELTIRNVTDTALEADIHPDSKYMIEDGRIRFYGEGWKMNASHAILFKTDQQLMRYSSFRKLQTSPVVQTGEGKLRFTGDFTKAGFDPGDVLTVRDPYRDNAGAFISRSSNVTVEDVKMHYMHGLGIVSQFSRNITLRRVMVEPAEGSGRIISSFADAFHFSGCAGLVRLLDCRTSGLHDDAVNIHGTHLKITAVEPRRLTVRFMHPQTYGFEAFVAGDSVAFVDPKTLQYTGYTKVRSATMLSAREMSLELAEEGGKTGDCVENLTWTPDVEIRGCRFARTNTRGVLVTTRGKVVIENNVFFRTGMHAILIADDAASWYESGPVRHVLIRSNRFEECGYNAGYVIAIAPENHTLQEGKFVHRNIRIENNVFKCFDTPLLTAKSVDGLVFSGNRFGYSSLLPGKGTAPAVQLTACGHVTMEKNTGALPWPLKVVMEHMVSGDLRSGSPFIRE